MVADLVKKGIDVFLYGGTSAGPNRPRSTGRSHVSYEGYYSRNRDYKEARSRRRYGATAGSDIREFVFDDRRDAEMVLSELCEIVDQ